MKTGRIIRPEQTAKIILPRIGFIKCGLKGEDGKPKSTDYFLAAGKYASYFTNVYPGKPSVIQIVFFDDSPETSCNEEYTYRDMDGRLFAKGDGENFKVWTKDKYEDYSAKAMPKLMETVNERCKSRKGWEVQLTLRFILPKVRGIGGFWEFNTKGNLSTIPSIRDAFDTVLNQNGYVKGVVFDLEVSFAKSQKPGSMSRYPVVNLIPNNSEENIKMIKDSFVKVDQKQLSS